MKCENCGTDDLDPERAICDGEKRWFCNHRCLGQWSMDHSGNVPA